MARPHTRRQLLLGGGAIAAVSPFLSPLTLPVARAGAKGPRNLLVVYAKGAWDVTYVLDPKDPEDPDVLENIDGPWRTESGGDLNPDEELYEVPGTNGLTIAANHVDRPAVTEFFDVWGSHCAVVNGIAMGSIVHDVSRIRIMTGTRNETNPDMGAISGWSHQGAAALGYIDFAGDGFMGNLASVSGRIGARGQIKMLFDDDSAAIPAPSGVDWTYPRFLPDETDDAAVQAFLKSRTDRFRTLHDDGAAASQLLDDLENSRLGADALYAASDILAAEINLGEELDITGQVSLALEMLQSDICRSVLINTGLSWDTHDNNTTQGSHNEYLYGGLSGLMQAIENAGLLDNTLVVVLSEFTRTPKLNAEDGKDHWPVASALLVGAGIEGGGRNLGGTDAILLPQTVDLSTGEVDPHGDEPTYANLIAGILHLMDIDSDEFLSAVTPYTGLGT